jgi:thiol-disulfide isomerase/thioredoxin
MPRSIIFAVLLILFGFHFGAEAQKDVALDAVRTAVVGPEDLIEIVRSPDTKKPILINFWATWCGPCRYEFPDLVKIDGEFRDRGLNFIIVSLDRPTLADTLVSDFLKGYGASMPSYLLRTERRRDAALAVRRLAPGTPWGIPLTLLFDANGKLVYRKNGVIEPVSLRYRIEAELPKKTEATE